MAKKRSNTGMIVVVVLLVVLLIAGIGAGIYYYGRGGTPTPTPNGQNGTLTPLAPPPAPTKTDWECAKGIYVPLQRNANADIQCMSQDAQNCLWKSSDSDCQALLTNPPSSLDPLVCTSAQYNDPKHWCYKGKQFFQCEDWKNQYNIQPGTSYGTAPTTVQTSWQQQCTPYY